MFVALKAKDRTRVTSIASEWDDAEDTLRESTAAGELVCPGCEQPLWLRTGTCRRRHFAHRSLADCPLEHQSPEVMEVKALMYRWLATKYPGKVHLEIALGIAGRDRTLDLVVQAEAGTKFAFWVFDRQQRDRDIMFSYRDLKGVSLHFIHTASTLKLKDPDQLMLTASQRDFIATSEFDSGLAPEGRGHLHFCSAEDSTVSIYRGLYCVHKPNIYRYAVLRSGSLESALISPKTGEVVFAEDVEARKVWRRSHYSKPPPVTRTKAVTVPLPAEPRTDPDTGTDSDTDEPCFNINGPFRCEVCGAVTTDWSQATPLAGTCICRPCIRRRRDKAGSEPGSNTTPEEPNREN